MKRRIKEVEDWLKLQPGELKDLTIIALVLAFCFAFRWEGVTTIGAWGINFILVFILVALSLSVHEVAHRWAATKYLARVRSKIFLSGIIAALVLVFVTNGYFIFAALWAITIKSIYTYRPGKPYPKWHLGPYDRAKIAIVGPLASFALAIVAKLLIPVLGPIAQKLMIINLWIAVINLFPFSTILPIVFWRMAPIISKEVAKGTPYVEGEFVFFGSRSMWAFSFVFVLIGSFGLVFIKSLMLSLLLAFSVAFILYLVWHYKFEGAKP